METIWELHAASIILYVWASPLPISDQFNAYIYRSLSLLISCLFSSLRRLASVKLTYSFFSINVVFIPHFALAQITSPTCHALPLATCYILRDTPGSNLRTILPTGFFLIFPGFIPSSSRQYNFLFESHIQHFLGSWVIIYYFVKLSSLIVTSQGRWYTS